MRLPASQITRMPWATPIAAPASRSADPRTPWPRRRLIARPALAPRPSPRPTASNSSVRTRTARGAGSTDSATPRMAGSRRMTRLPPTTAPRSPPSCGNRPDRRPDTKARTIRTTAPTSSRFTRSVSGRGRPAARVRPDASAHDHLDRWALAGGCSDRVRAPRHGSEVDDRRFEHRDVDAGDVAGIRGGAFPHGDEDRSAIAPDYHRVQGSARLDAAPPGGADGAVTPGREIQPDH